MSTCDQCELEGVVHPFGVNPKTGKKVYFFWCPKHRKWVAREGDRA